MNYTIKWIGQAGYILTGENVSIVIDPYCSDSLVSLNMGFNREYPSLIPKSGLVTDIAIATHNHLDHLDVETYRDYIQTKKLLGPDSCIRHVKDAGLNKIELYPLNRGDKINLYDFAFYAVFAEHTEDSIGVVIEHEGIYLYFSGDSTYNEKLFEVADFHPDIVFICINGKFGNMDWKDAVKVCTVIKPKVAIPMHYDMFKNNYQDPLPFLEAIKENGINGLILNRGTEYNISDILSIKDT